MNISQSKVAIVTGASRGIGAAENEFGGVDILVNNADIMKLARFTEADDTTFDQSRG
jgi:3-oxoacyl-[acyl-carrier protein] reductase